MSVSKGLSWALSESEGLSRDLLQSSTASSCFSEGQVRYPDFYFSKENRAVLYKEQVGVVVLVLSLPPMKTFDIDTTIERRTRVAGVIGSENRDVPNLVIVFGSASSSK
jgi:hypothetical protein